MASRRGLLVLLLLAILVLILEQLSLLKQQELWSLTVGCWKQRNGPRVFVSQAANNMHAWRNQLWKRVAMEKDDSQENESGEKDLERSHVEDNPIPPRDVMVHEPWPELELNVSRPGQFHPTVHYLWCGVKHLQFGHYLGLLSILRILKPLKLVFHYTHLPKVDSSSYHTWFQELNASMPNLEMQWLATKHACGSKGLLQQMLDILAQDGGFYVSDGVILSHAPSTILDVAFWSAFTDMRNLSTADFTMGMAYSKRGFGLGVKEVYLGNIITNKPMCGKIKHFNEPRGHSEQQMACVVVGDKHIYPRDTWQGETKFARLARWLYYGRRAPISVQRDPQNPIPRITHYAWMKSPKKKLFLTPEFHFPHFLSVLSALYIGGFHHVYVHAEEEPTGPWWRRLQVENVTFVTLARPDKVYQQTIIRQQHKSDIIRFLTLYKYGGAYQDMDVIWTNRAPDWLMEYPVVASLDWPRYGKWPDAFNMGVMMAQRGASWIHHVLETYKDFRAKDFGYNALLMPYKNYEWYPDSIYLDRYLQVICYMSICHPTWHPDYQRDLDDQSPTMPFDWREARAFHVTYPKPEASLASPEAIAKGTDMFAEIGRYVLEQSGWGHLLNGTKY